jgi:NADH-quinone oxidoreductase subunit J
MATTVFYIFAVIAVASATLCILQRNPVSAALWLVSTMFSLAAIYVLLDAQFIAAIQVLVYAGAVMVLFLFVIMLLNLGHATSDMRGPSGVAAAVVIVGLLLIELLALLRYNPQRLAAEVAQSPALADPRLAFPSAIPMRPLAEVNVVGDLGAPLFQTYLVPFEITSILLLAAIIGAVVLAKRKV